jgi:DNA-binding transcriptional LysR family regulator
MPPIPWDDLRYVLAVAAEGSLAGAARVLGVNHTTVLRRVNAFEERLGLRLFERLPTGYILTSGGAELIEAARLMEDTVAALERRLAGQDRRLSGNGAGHDHRHAGGHPAAADPGRLPDKTPEHSDRVDPVERGVQPDQASRGRRDPSGG